MLLEILFSSQPRARKRRRRGFAGGAVNRLTADWLTAIVSADEEARRSLRKLRARSRELWMNNDYTVKFLSLLTNNIVGPRGIWPQLKIEEARPTKDNPKPPRDRFAEAVIEREFKRWGKKANASATGDMSFRDQQRLFIETLARDGEVLIHKLRGFDNPFKFALRFLEADYLDEDHNRRLANGNTIRMSVELDVWRKPVAYHLRTDHPGDLSYIFGGHRFVRVPAEDIIHAFIRHRPEQTRGVPWIHSAMTRLNMIGAYEEAELVAARIASSKMGFFVEKDADYQASDEDDEGNLITDFEPGIFEKLPAGVEAQLIEPTHPGTSFQPFLQQMLHGAASGLGVAYTSLTTDLKGVNFSSGRMGLLEERDFYRTLQNWFAEHFCDEVFTEWLRTSLLSGVLPLPAAKIDKFNQPRWQTRGWQWVDPLKEAKANIESNDAGIKTKLDILSEQGRDLEDTFAQLAEEKRLAEELGLSFGNNTTEPIPPEPAAAADEGA